MLTGASISDKYKLIPDTESVTFYIAASTGFDSGTTVEGAKRHDITLAERQALAVQFQENMLRWHLWSSALGTIVPKIGDKIVDSAGGVWMVAAIGNRTLRQVYRCYCSKGI